MGETFSTVCVCVHVRSFPQEVYDISNGREDHMVGDEGKDGKTNLRVDNLPQSMSRNKLHSLFSRAVLKKSIFRFLIDSHINDRLSIRTSKDRFKKNNNNKNKSHFIS